MILSRKPCYFNWYLFLRITKLIVETKEDKMGLLSSQARLLNLTGRMHQIEYKAAKLEAQKLQMANESRRVYDDYQQALEATKITTKMLSPDGSITDTLLTGTKILTYGDLNEQFALVNNEGKTIISQSLHNDYLNTNTLTGFLNAQGLVSTGTHQEQLQVAREDNPEYTNAIQRYNSDHSNWANYENAYQKYLEELEGYPAKHQTWENNKNAYDAYLNQLKEYNANYSDWITKKNNHDTWEEKHRIYEQKHAQWVIDYNEWLNRKPVREDKEKSWWTIDQTEHNLAEEFHEAGGNCYTNAQEGYFSCYGHILAHIIDYSEGKGFIASNNSYGGDTNTSWYNGVNNSYHTTTGRNFIIETNNINGYADFSTDNCRATWNTISGFLDDEENFKAIAQEGEIFNLSSSSSEGEKLISKYNTDGSLKSLKQWAKDLFYITKTYENSYGTALDDALGISHEDVTGTLVSFNNCLSTALSITETFNEEIYTSYYTEWQSDEPIEPQDEPEPELPGEQPQQPPVVNAPGPEPQPPVEPQRPGDEPILEDYINGIEQYIYHDPVTITHTTFTDKGKAQWFANLWCKMEKLEETPKIQEKQITQASGEILTVYSITDIEKSETKYLTDNVFNTPENENYVVISDELLNSNKWLTDMVNNGFVMFEKYISNENKFNGTSIAVDVSLDEIQDKSDLRKAEAKYEADMRRIDMKDRKYDYELAALDNERNAIKNEMETLKTVARDNVDRTFKLFG